MSVDIDVVSHRSEAIKGVILIVMRFIAFIVEAIMVGLQLDMRYIAIGFCLLFDNFCLFLMFRGNQKLYTDLCGRLYENRCIKIIYGTQYEPVSVKEDAQDISMNHLFSAENLDLPADSIEYFKRNDQ